MINFKSSSYVQALYELGVEENSTNILYEESQKLLDLIRENIKLISYFSDISVDKKDKHSLINEIISNQTLRNFLFVVIDEKRARFINIILEKYIKKIDDERGVAQGKIYTTEQIDPGQLKVIEDKISSKLNKKIKLTGIKDKEIIGGIKVVVEDDVWDYTIVTKIKELTKIIVERKGEENG